MVRENIVGLAVAAHRAGNTGRVGGISRKSVVVGRAVIAAHIVQVIGERVAHIGLHVQADGRTEPEFQPQPQPDVDCAIVVRCAVGVQVAQVGFKRTVLNHTVLQRSVGVVGVAVSVGIQQVAFGGKLRVTDIEREVRGEKCGGTQDAVVVGGKRKTDGIIVQVGTEIQGPRKIRVGRIQAAP